MRKFDFYWVNTDGRYTSTVVSADNLADAVKELAKVTNNLVRIVDVFYL